MTNLRFQDPNKPFLAFRVKENLRGILLKTIPNLLGKDLEERGNTSTSLKPPVGSPSPKTPAQDHPLRRLLPSVWPYQAVTTEEIARRKLEDGKWPSGQVAWVKGYTEAQQMQQLATLHQVKGSFALVWPHPVHRLFLTQPFVTCRLAKGTKSVLNSLSQSYLLTNSLIYLDRWSPPLRLSLPPQNCPLFWFKFPRGLLFTRRTQTVNTALHSSHGWKEEERCVGSRKELVLKGYATVHTSAVESVLQCA